MPTLTVKIAAGGTIYDHNGSSLAGHMWLSIDRDGVAGPATPVSMGFAPKENPFGPLPYGKVMFTLMMISNMRTLITPEPLLSVTSNTSNC